MSATLLKIRNPKLISATRYRSRLSRYSAVAILAALDSVLGAVRAELDGVYDNRIFISGFVTNAIVAVILTFIGDRLGLDLYLVALITFGLRIFNNVALIRRHFI